MLMLLGLWSVRVAPEREIVTAIHYVRKRSRAQHSSYERKEDTYPTSQLEAALTRSRGEAMLRSMGASSVLAESESHEDIDGNARTGVSSGASIHSLYWSRVSKEMQPSRNLFPTRVTPLNPAKLMEVNSMHSDKKLSPRLATRSNPAKSMEVNDVQCDKKKSPRLVTLPNPAKSMVVSAVQHDKK